MVAVIRHSNDFVYDDVFLLFHLTGSAECNLIVLRVIILLIPHSLNVLSVFENREELPVQLCHSASQIGPSTNNINVYI